MVSDSHNRLHAAATNTGPKYAASLTRAKGKHFNYQIQLKHEDVLRVDFFLFSQEV